ncbi:MAG TPA: hypothetical protein VGD23_13635 [Sphingomicrobium sp.]
MKWKVVRLELASSWQFPRGSAGRSYLVRVPLTDEGVIDTAALEAQPARATVRRYWPNQADMVGQLVYTSPGYAIQYELNGVDKANGHSATNGNGEPPLLRFGADTIKLGNEILLTEPDGNQARYRIAKLQ